MTNEFLHFEKINRETWQSLHRKTTPPLTEEELDSIKSFNDQISLQDVTDIYLPLAHLILGVSLSVNQPLVDSCKFCCLVSFLEQVLNWLLRMVFYTQTVS